VRHISDSRGGQKRKAQGGVAQFLFRHFHSPVDDANWFLVVCMEWQAAVSAVSGSRRQQALARNEPQRNAWHDAGLAATVPQRPGQPRIPLRFMVGYAM
jgi:hypothetical protein